MSFSTVDALLSRSGYAAKVTSTTSSSGLLLSPEFLLPLAQNSPTALHSLKPSMPCIRNNYFSVIVGSKPLGDAGPVAASASLKVVGRALLSLASLWLNLYLSIHAPQTLLLS